MQVVRFLCSADKMLLVLLETISIITFPIGYILRLKTQRPLTPPRGNWTSYLN